MNPRDRQISHTWQKSLAMSAAAKCEAAHSRLFILIGCAWTPTAGWRDRSDIHQTRRPNLQRVQRFSAWFGRFKQIDMSAAHHHPE
jgi:hypothetical protein